jgi:predicted ATPase
VDELSAANAELRRQLEAKDYRCPRIVMTGGPCAGKTTAMRVIRERLEDRNVRVFVAPEASSMLFTAGAMIKDFGSPEAILRFQVNLARVQLTLEDRIGELADAAGHSVLLCDRGLLDGRAYCDSATWGHVMEELGASSPSLRDRRYDAVIHMTTAARGAEKFYTLEQAEGSGARHESIEEARAVDNKLQDAWTGHCQHVVISNEGGNFNAKLERVVQRVFNIIGMHDEGEIVRKFTLPYRSADTIADAAKASGAKPQLFEATVIHVNDCYQLRNRIPRGRNQGVHWATVRTSPKAPWREQTISGREYLRRAAALAATHGDSPKTHKIVCVFSYEENIFTTHFFTEPEPLVVVEVRGSSATEAIPFPSFLTSSGPVKEVTKDPQFASSSSFVAMNT